MYQLIGIINDEKVLGLVSILNYMNESFFSKDDPVINEHRYHITKKQYNEETQNIHNIDKTKTYIFKIIEIRLNIITIKHEMSIITLQLT